MKQTAVEWLIKELYFYPIDDIVIDKFNQAKAMEKEQIINAYSEGQNTPYEYSEDNEVNWYDGNNYYNETFKSE